MELTVRTDQTLSDRIKGFWGCNKRKMLVIAAITVIALVGLFMYSTFCVGDTYPEGYEGDSATMKIVEAMINFICTTCSGDTVKDAVSYPFATDAIGAIANMLKTYAAVICSMLWFSTTITAYINQQMYGELIVKRILVLAIASALILKAPDICDWIMDIGKEVTLKVANELNNPASGGTSGSFKVEEKTASIMNAIREKAQDAYNETVGNISEDEKERRRNLRFKELGLETGNTGNKVADWFINSCNSMTMALDDIDNGTALTLDSRDLITGTLMEWRASFARSFTVPATILVVLIIPWLCTAGAFVMILIACYSRGVEMAILKALSPIPMCLLANEPLGTGAGSKFMKNLAAVSLQGAVLIIIPIICSQLIITKLDNFVGTMASGNGLGLMMQAGIEIGAIAIAEGAIMMRSLSLSQKALGLQ